MAEFIFPLVILMVVSIATIIKIQLEEKNKYLPKKDTMYRVVNIDKYSKLAICTTDEKNFFLFKITPNITNGVCFIRKRSGYNVIERENK